MSRILITGATGTVGSALLPLLQDAGHTVFAGSTSGRDVSGAPGRRLDLLNPETLPASFEGVDAVFIVTPAHPRMAAMTANAVAAAGAAGVRQLVRISGASADPLSPFAVARVQGECDQHIINSGIPYTLLRPKNFMQNFLTFLRGMIRSGAVYSSQGDGRIPFIDARDIAAVSAAVLASPASHAGRVYTLTGPEALTNSEALEIIGQATGKPVALVPISEEQAVESMRRMGMPEELVEMMSSLNRVIAAGCAADVTDTVSAITGCPARTLRAFAQEHAEAWD